MNTIHISRHRQTRKLRAGASLLSDMIADIRRVADAGTHVVNHTVVAWTGVNTIPTLQGNRLYHPEELALDVAHWAMGRDGRPQFRVGRLVPAGTGGRLEFVLGSLYDAAMPCSDSRRTANGELNPERARGAARFAVLAQAYLGSIELRSQARLTFIRPTPYFVVPDGLELGTLCLTHDGAQYAPAADFGPLATPSGAMLSVHGIKERLIPNPARLAWEGIVSADGSPLVDATAEVRDAWINGVDAGSPAEIKARNNRVIGKFDDLGAIFANSGGAEGDYAKLLAPTLDRWSVVRGLPAATCLLAGGTRTTEFNVAPYGDVNLSLPDPRLWGQACA